MIIMYNDTSEKITVIHTKMYAVMYKL